MKMRSQSKARFIKTINDALALPLTELSVKSMLADTRKLLELTGSTLKYQTLKFYCDWVLHTKMDRKFASQLLETFDIVWDDWIVRKIPIPADFHSTLGYKIGFYGFEKELSEFLGPHGITLPWHGYRDKWMAFEKSYCDIVQDTWLEYSGKKHLKQINGASIRTYEVADHPAEGKTYVPGECLPRGIEWSFLKDGNPVFAFTITAPSSESVARTPHG
jgi:hypothetical protein